MGALLGLLLGLGLLLVWRSGDRAPVRASTGPGWQDRTAAVERELRRRYGSTPQLAAATEQSDRIGRLLSSGQLTSQVLVLRGK